MKTLVLGLGNPILGDDSVGLRVTRALTGRFTPGEVTVLEASLAGLNLLELLADFDKAIIIDAIQTKEGKAGQIYRLEPEAFAPPNRLATSHNVDFTTVLELGKKLGLSLPQQIVIFAIEVKNVASFSEECTPEVERAIPVVTRMVMKELSTSS